MNNNSTNNISNDEYFKKYINNYEHFSELDELHIKDMVFIKKCVRSSYKFLDKSFESFKNGVQFLVKYQKWQKNNSYKDRILYYKFAYNITSLFPKTMKFLQESDEMVKISIFYGTDGIGGINIYCYNNYIPKSTRSPHNLKDLAQNYTSDGEAKYNGEIHFATFKNVLKALSLNNDDKLLKFIKNNSFNSFISFLVLVKTLVAYKTYNITYYSVGEIIKKIMEDDNPSFDWLIRVFSYIVVNKPIIFDALDVKWFNNNRAFPVEFCIEKLSSNNEKEVAYNDLCDNILNVMLQNYQNDDTYNINEWLNGIFKKYLTLQLKGVEYSKINDESASEYIAYVEHTLNGSNVKNRLKALRKIKPIPIPKTSEVQTILKEIMRLNFQHQITDSSILGFNFFTDIQNRTYFSSKYKTVCLNHCVFYSAMITYMSIIFKNEETVIRWLVWMYFQQLLRQNSVQIEGSCLEKDYDKYVYSRIPVEIEEWILSGTLPYYLTYNDEIKSFIVKIPLSLRNNFKKILKKLNISYSDSPENN